VLSAPCVEAGFSWSRVMLLLLSSALKYKYEGHLASCCNFCNAFCDTDREFRKAAQLRFWGRCLLSSCCLGSSSGQELIRPHELESCSCLRKPKFRVLATLQDSWRCLKKAWLACLRTWTFQEILNVTLVVFLIFLGPYCYWNSCFLSDSLGLPFGFTVTYSRFPNLLCQSSCSP